MRSAGVLVLLAALAVLGWVGTRGFDVAPPPVRLGTNVWIGYEPLHAAAAVGALPEGLRLVEYVSATQVLRAFENGDIDAAGVTLDEAVRLEASTHDVALVAVLDFSNGGDAIIARPERASLAALAGARIAVEQTAVGAMVLARALEQAGVDPKQVSTVAVNVNEHLEAWDAGVDAVVTFEPTRTQLLALGGVELFSSRDIPGQIADVLVVRRSQRSERARLAEAWFKARAWALASPDEFARLAALRLRVSPDEVRRSLDTVRLPEEAESERAVRGGLLPIAIEFATLLGQRGQRATAADARALFAEGAEGP